MCTSAPAGYHRLPAPCTASSATAECKRPGVLRPADADKGGGEGEGCEGEGELHDDEFEHGYRSWWLVIPL